MDGEEFIDFVSDSKRIIFRFMLVIELEPDVTISYGITSIELFNLDRIASLRMHGRDIKRRYILDKATGDKLSCRQFIKEWENKFNKIKKIQRRLSYV